jgi:hypothetical protein
VVVMLCVRSLDDLGDKKQAALYGGSAALVGLALVGFLHCIFTQAQGKVLNGYDRVGHGLEPAGVDRAHGFYDVKETVDLRQHAGAFHGLKLQPCQIGNACDIGRCQGHGAKRVETNGKSGCSALPVASYSQAIGYYPAFGESAAKVPFLKPN